MNTNQRQCSFRRHIQNRYRSLPHDFLMQTKNIKTKIINDEKQLSRSSSGTKTPTFPHKGLLQSRRISDSEMACYEQAAFKSQLQDESLILDIISHSRNFKRAVRRQFTKIKDAGNVPCMTVRLPPINGKEPPFSA